MAEFKLYKDAILTVDLPDDGLRAGDIGTVVERHESSADNYLDVSKACCLRYSDGVTFIKRRKLRLRWA